MVLVVIVVIFVNENAPDVISRRFSVLDAFVEHVVGERHSIYKQYISWHA
jgi:hypothetical protein